MRIWIGTAAAAAAYIGAAAAHEDFPAQWCGGQDCRFAAPKELTAVCDGILVENEAVSTRTPISQISVWNGDRPAICARNRKLNLCNPTKGDCEGQDGLGLLIPEDDVAAWREAARRACADQRAEISAPASTPVTGGGATGGGGIPGAGMPGGGGARRGDTGGSGDTPDGTEDPADAASETVAAPLPTLDPSLPATRDPLDIATDPGASGLEKPEDEETAGAAPRPAGAYQVEGGVAAAALSATPTADVPPPPSLLLALASGAFLGLGWLRMRRSLG